MCVSFPSVKVLCGPVPILPESPLTSSLLQIITYGAICLLSSGVQVFKAIAGKFGLVWSSSMTALGDFALHSSS